MAANFASSGWPGPDVNINNVVYNFAAPSRLNIDYFGRNAGYYPGGPPGNFEYYDGLGGTNAILTMRPDRVYITADLARAIPEPGAWIPMLLGIGALGTNLRRNQHPRPFIARDSAI